MKDSTIKHKEEFNWVLNQIKNREDLLKGKDIQLAELFRMCENPAQLSLITDLIDRFNFVSISLYAKMLEEMAAYIKSLGYKSEEIAVVSLAIDAEADSSQSVLQDLKVPLCIQFDRKIKDCNMFDRDSFDRRYQAGCRHFIGVDEFTGTGSTIVERFYRFGDMKFKDATIQFCVLTGMQDAIDHVEKEGINLKVFNILQKGISDFYQDEDKRIRQSQMTEIESRLADKINKVRLSAHSFGFRQSESLYYKELGNIPNNVFPVFWWKQYSDGRKRNPLFTRVQNGY